MSVVVSVMLSLMSEMLSLLSVMCPPPALCNLSVRTDVKLCILGVLALAVSLVSRIVMKYEIVYFLNMIKNKLQKMIIIRI